MSMFNLGQCLYREGLTTNFISLVLGEYYCCGESTLKDSGLEIESSLVAVLNDYEVYAMRILFMLGQGGDSREYDAYRIDEYDMGEGVRESSANLVNLGLILERTSVVRGDKRARSTHKAGDSMWSGFTLTPKGYILVYQTFTHPFNPSVETTATRVPEPLLQLPQGNIK